MVVPSSATLIWFLRACSLPLRIASGTSLALPMPTPTWPLPSPTTISALKLKRRPPFTTFATRLMWMTRSWRSSRLFESIGVMLSVRPSETQAALARTVSQGLDSAVIDVAAAVEHHLLDALSDAHAGDTLPNLLGHRGLVRLLA